jgi:uncharacterized protein
MRNGPLLFGLLLFLAAGHPAVADCTSAALTPIAQLRAGDMTDDRPVTVEGVVTGVFTGSDQLGGFFMQEAGDPPSGIFVHAPKLRGDGARPGRRVQVEGRFLRFHGRPQISRVSVLRDCGEAGLPEPVTLELPRDAHRFARLQDVKVRFPQTLAVTGNHELHRHGTLRLSTDGRLLHPGNRGASTGRADAARQILLDDGSYRVNPDPIPYLGSEGTRRTGDVVDGLTGVLTHAFGEYRVHPTRSLQFNPLNPRPAPPPSTDGALRIAAFNVENFFVTLGDRGPADRTERDRQLDKLAAAVHGLDADVLSLSEVENRRPALWDLVERVNADLPATRRYEAVDHPYRGRDAIKVAILYRPARLQLAGSVADRDPVHSRPPLLAWFRPRGGGPLLGIVSVHFKSKSGCPAQGDVDLGQGCWNALRTAQSRRLLAWLGDVRRGDAPVLIAGDLNAYAAEDPSSVLRTAGKWDLTALHRPEPGRYSYVFHGQAGQLDYLLAGTTIAERTARGGIWHINADEPPFLGFRGRQPAAGPWRASDHDPVWADVVWH